MATHHLSYLLLVLLVFTNGGARAIYYSASQATVPELVEPDAFAHANGILSGTEAATEHLGGPILGTLAFAATKALPFFADAAAVGLSGLSLLGFRTERLSSGPAHHSILDGVRQLLKDRSLRLLVSLLAALAGLQGLVMGVLVIVATVDWGVSKSLYGVFLAVGAAGNVPGALLADRVANRIGNVPTLVASALVSGVAYLVMSSAKGWLVAGAAFCVVSFAVYAGSVMANSLRQRLSPRADGQGWLGVARGRLGSLSHRVAHRRGTCRQVGGPSADIRRRYRPVRRGHCPRRPAHAQPGRLREGGGLVICRWAHPQCLLERGPALDGTAGHQQIAGADHRARDPASTDGAPTAQPPRTRAPLLGPLVEELAPVAPAPVPAVA